MQWESYEPAHHAGRSYGMKAASFPPYFNFPRQTGKRLSLAVGGSSAPRNILREGGWELLNPLEVTRDPWAYQRFIRETEILKKLRHPNIIGIHEVGQIDGQHYFAMDYVPGQSLAGLLRDGPIDPERTAECVAAMGRAVHYLHAHNIVHRDLKPSNILLDADGNPYITDFGLAKVFENGGQRTRTGTIVGTPSYMAPEQAAGHTSEVSPRTDVYSLGAILYEMLSGRPPFRHDNPLDTLVDVLEGEPTLLSKLNRRIPRELEVICMRCLEKDPQRRYESAAALAEDLEHYLRREPIAARPSGLVPKLQRWVRREPALVSHLAGLLTAAGIAQVRFTFVGTDLAYHLRIMSVLVLWAVASFVFQRRLHRDSLANGARFAWAAVDAALLTLALAIIEAPHGPLLIGYPLLVAASGLFFRVRLVWFMTFASLVGYAALVWLRPEEIGPPHHAIIFAAVLAVLGFIVAYQVHRVRVLSRYYEHRRLP
jgi:eukaryotic-like serine/threonine-protein kinase